MAGLEAPAQFRGRNLFDSSAPEAVYGSIGFGETDSLAFPLGRFGRWSDGSGWPRRACVRTQHYRLDMNVRHNGEAVQENARDIFLADMQADPRETVNLAASPAFSESREYLLGLLNRHLAGAVEGVYVPE